MIHNFFKAMLLMILAAYFPSGGLFAAATQQTLAQQQAAQAAAKAAATKTSTIASVAKTVSTTVAATKPVTTVNTTTAKTSSSGSNNTSTPSDSINPKQTTTSALAGVHSTSVIPGIEKTSGATQSLTGPTDSGNYLSLSPTSSQQ